MGKRAYVKGLSDEEHGGGLPPKFSCKDSYTSAARLRTNRCAIQKDRGMGIGSCQMRSTGARCIRPTPEFGCEENQMDARAPHAQSINGPSAAAHVRWRA